MTSTVPKSEFMWAYLVHLGFNMWGDRIVPESNRKHWYARPYLRFDERLWRDLIDRWAKAGINTVVIDLGEGVRYESHPELAVRGSWPGSKLREELIVLRERGIEPIPKLNFSTTHDIWLAEYARQVSTPAYYAVCRDLIEEAVELFDRPRLFHLGMDEETAEHQSRQAYAVMRQHELWWHDLNFLVAQVERNGARPWIWSDYEWNHPDEFFAKMPKTVLQSNWYYSEEFGPDISYVKAYDDLEQHGYDQVPTASNWTTPVNFERTVAYCREHIAPERLKGFFQTVWYPTLEECADRHFEAIEQVARAREAWQAR